jgi:hypothetical protein
MEPHQPYVPPDEIVTRVLGRRGDPERTRRTLAGMNIRSRFNWLTPDADTVAALETLYDGEVLSLDGQLRRLFVALEARGFLANAVVVITADHGEEFMDHGGMSHGTTLHDELIHVPLLVQLPGQTGRRDVREATSLVDIAPTLLDLLDIFRPAPLEGRSLAPLLGLPADRRRLAALAERLLGRAGPPVVAAHAQLLGNSMGNPTVHHHATIVDARKLILHTDGAIEAYDLRTDPRERIPNALSESARAPVRAAMLQLTRQGSHPDASPTAELTPETRERLRALGYVE